ncbi:MAG: hypothetical protein HC811_02340 [Flammeovirgaceae bacterium]|nr:hypothetical protein [Flammeovirgaceae bacterium]
MNLYYGFNHLESYRSFMEAARLDPQFAMAYWGQALALGPNINSPMDPADNKVVFAAVQKALQYISNSTPIEQALILAISKRYINEAPQDRTSLDVAYANSMKEAAASFSDNLEVLTLFAEAQMDLHPWNFWNRDGSPKPWTMQTVELIEKIIGINPLHPGANHLYIHITEASTNPGRATASADRLVNLVPGAGHLVHMPSHVYIRTGRYEDGVRVNQKAVLADEEYVTQCRAQGIYPLAYYPHNYHFLWACAMLSGKNELSISAANKLADVIDISLMGSPDLATLQHYYSSPLYSMIRFGQWKDLLKIPRPEDSLYYAAGIWQFGQGLAQLRTGDRTKAMNHLLELEKQLMNPTLNELKIWGFNSFGNILAIGAHVLRAEIEAQNRNYTTSISILKEAIKMEDALLYQEPPDWFLPTRQILGAVLLEADMAKEAEKYFREDLAVFPSNGWSLFGLYQSLMKQEKSDEGQKVKVQYDLAFKYADIELTAARF